TYSITTNSPAATPANDARAPLHDARTSSMGDRRPRGTEHLSLGPADFLDVPCFRHPRGQLVSGRFRMAVRCAAVPGILEQATGNLGSHWVDCHVRDDD